MIEPTAAAPHQMFQQQVEVELLKKRLDSLESNFSRLLDATNGLQDNVNRIVSIIEVLKNKVLELGKPL